jgi:hypothetical protein
MKIIGKPYSGKPNVRFDEGELAIELLATTPALYSTEVPTHFSEDSFLVYPSQVFYLLRLLFDFRIG